MVSLIFPSHHGPQTHTDSRGRGWMLWDGISTHHYISQETGSHIHLQTALDNMPAELIQGCLQIYKTKHTQGWLNNSFGFYRHADNTNRAAQDNHRGLPIRMAWDQWECVWGSGQSWPLKFFWLLFTCLYFFFLVMHCCHEFSWLKLPTRLCYLDCCNRFCSNCKNDSSQYLQLESISINQSLALHYPLTVYELYSCQCNNKNK